MKKRILILADYHCLFKDDGWDSDSIRQLIAVLTVFRNEEVIFTDRDQKIRGLSLPEELLENVFFTSDFTMKAMDGYDAVIAHYHLEADFFMAQENGEVFKNLYLLTNKSNPNLFFPGIGEYLKERQLQVDIRRVNKQLRDFLRLNILPAGHDTPEISLTKAGNVCIVCDFNQNFFIGDSCFWYYDLNYKLFILNRKQPPETVDIYMTSVKNHRHIERIYSSSFPDNVRLFNASVNSINFGKYDLVIAEFLLYFNVKNKISDRSRPLVSYTFPVDREKNKRLGPAAFGTYFRLDDFNRQLLYHKKQYNNIEIREEEIREANLWLESCGVRENDRVFALINEASQAEKIMAPHVFLKTVRWLVTAKKYRILMFSQNAQLKDALERNLDPEIFDQIIFPGRVGIRKEMALMASGYVNGMLAPCTGLAHLFNGINYYLHHMLGKERKKCIVYTGRQTYVGDYHPLLWWNFRYVDCLSYVTKEGKAFLAEKKDILTIRNFDEVSLFPNKIPHRILRDKIEEILAD